jgi:hypothetical protein
VEDITEGVKRYRDTRKRNDHEKAWTGLTEKEERENYLYLRGEDPRRRGTVKEPTKEEKRIN